MSIEHILSIAFQFVCNNKTYNEIYNIICIFNAIINIIISRSLFVYALFHVSIMAAVFPPCNNDFHPSFYRNKHAILSILCLTPSIVSVDNIIFMLVKCSYPSDRTHSRCVNWFSWWN